MKRRFMTGLATAAMLTSIAVPVTNNLSLSNNTVQASATSDAFLNKVGTQAQKTSKKYGVYASLMLAQAALESSWGNSTLSTRAYNFFGMKAGTGCGLDLVGGQVWQGRSEVEVLLLAGAGLEG